MKRSKHRYWLIFCSLMVFGAISLPASHVSALEPLVVFLVRHAEKVDASRDPKLSNVGTKRAQELATVLRDAKVKYVHSSDYIRTRDTAAPIAERRKLKVKLYDPTDLRSLVSKVRESGGRHLIVGHSTTTPSMVKLLGGEPGTNINEAGEYDRLYIVTITASGEVSTVLMRYGKPFIDSGVE